MADIEKLTERLDAMQREIDRLRAVNEIQNIMGRYEILLTGRTIHRVADEVFAMWMPDVSMEFSGNGVFTGSQAVQWMFSVLLSPDNEPIHKPDGSPDYGGALFIHHVDTPIIQVAADGKTAHCVFFSVGLESPYNKEKGKREAQWCFGKYSAEFIKGDCGWRIWHLHWFRTFLQDYYRAWTDKYEENSPVSDGTKWPVNVLPTTYHRPYHLTKEMLPVPCCPDPYEAHDGSDWILGPWVKNGKAIDET